MGREAAGRRCYGRGLKYTFWGWSLKTLALARFLTASIGPFSDQQISGQTMSKPQLQKSYHASPPICITSELTTWNSILFRTVSDSSYLILITISAVADKLRLSNMQLQEHTTQHTNSEEFDNSFWSEPRVQMCYQHLHLCFHRCVCGSLATESPGAFYV